MVSGAAGCRKGKGAWPRSPAGAEVMRSPLVWDQWRHSKAAIVKIKAHSTADAVSNVSASLQVLFIGLGSLSH